MVVITNLKLLNLSRVLSPDYVGMGQYLQKYLFLVKMNVPGYVCS